VLSVINNKTIYNEIEYVYSIAAIISVLFELGIRNNLLYEYKDSQNTDKLINDVTSYFGFQVVIYSIFGCFLSVYCVITGSGTWLALYVFVRSIVNYFTSFFNLLYRLVDTPSRIFIYSIAINLLTTIISLLFWISFDYIDIHVFFICQSFFVIFLAIYSCKYVSTETLLGIKQYLARSIKYAWPITMNIFLFMIINNYGKLYARNFLTADEMTHISLVQRLSLFVQLAHTSAAGYLSKRLFLDKSNKIDIKLLALYSTMVFGGTLVTILTIPFLRFFKGELYLTFDTVTFLLIGYTIAWCYGSYFELYLNKYNKNILLPLFTGLSTTVFLIVAHSGVFEPLLNISMGMFIAMLVNFTLILFSILKLEKSSHA
jgi:hypothetical protein